MNVKIIIIDMLGKTNFVVLAQSYELFYNAHKKRTVSHFLSAQISHARAFSVIHIARVMTRRLLR